MIQNPLPPHLIYGQPPLDLISPPGDSLQVSPIIIGSHQLASLPENHFESALLYAPPGVQERRYATALILRALKPMGQLCVLAPKDKGGQRLRKELEALGLQLEEGAKRHHRLCWAQKKNLNSETQDTYAREGAPRHHGGLLMYTQPGVFSWDRLDEGTALLLKHLPDLGGTGADLGVGIGHISQKVLGSAKVKSLKGFDLDARAIALARQNIQDPRFSVQHADVRYLEAPAQGLDFVVMNPPFHNGGIEDKSLGQTFVRKAAEQLRTSGCLWMVANRHLPYETLLADSFKTVRMVEQTGQYKIFEARK